MLKYLRALARHQLHALDDHIRLIILHPNYPHQYVLLSEFLTERTVYLRFTGQNLSYAQAHHALDEALQIQQGTTVPESTSLLVLDECDRVHPEALSVLLPELVNHLSSGRVVVLSRKTPTCVIHDTALRKRTAFLPHDDGLMLWDYAQRDAETHLLEVRAFGGGQVLLNGMLVNEWDGMLPRSLFFYLVDRGLATRNEIFETFWPALNVREATNVFHVTKRKISEVLGIDLTAYWSGYYRISPNIHLSYDVVLFTDLVNTSAILPAQQADAPLTNAIGLYRGDYLHSSMLDWCGRRREELRQNFSEALFSLGKLKEQAGQTRNALSLYLRAAAMAVQREDLNNSITALTEKLGIPVTAL